MRTLESFHIDPGHGDVFEEMISLSKNEGVLFLELIEMRAAQFDHDMFLLEAITKLATDVYTFTQIHVRAHFPVICVSCVSICGWFSLATKVDALTVSCAGNFASGLRFKD
jgi:hypothetical protein